MNTKHLYYFGWPSGYGGADTKLAHLLDLLSGHLRITVVPNNEICFKDKKWTTFLDERGISYTTYQKLPTKLDGVALSLCNPYFFSEGLIHYVKQKDVPIIWSSEMMWHHPYEKTYIEKGFIDRLLYVSEGQKKALDYESFCDVSTVITGNFVNPEFFPYRKRTSTSELVIGRLSRAEPTKYPDDFPEFYESFGEDFRLRVMAWDNQLAKKWDQHPFDQRWEFLEKYEEPAAKFLQSLDLFVYNLGPDVIESWGRSTVEAMLTGAIPLVATGHNFHELIIEGETGYICADNRQFKQCVDELARDKEKRRTMSIACHEHAVNNLCDVDQHLKIWMEALDV